MKISSGKQNKLRCIIVEDEYKDIKVYYKDFDDVLEKYEYEDVEIVKIYNITKSLARELSKVCISYFNKEIDEIEFAYRMIKMLTNIEMNLNIKNKKDKIEFKTIVEEPSNLLQTVLNEMNIMIIKYYETEKDTVIIQTKQLNMSETDVNLDAIKQLSELEEKLKKEGINYEQ